MTPGVPIDLFTMSYFSRNAEAFRDELEVYLDSEPGEDDSRLEEIPLRLQEIEDHGDSGPVARIVQLLGTALGANRNWQGPFREKGLLAHVAQKIDPATTSSELSKQYLRVIGNSVADNDQNRDVFISIIPKLSHFLDQEPLRQTILAVLLNICNDYEPAQTAAAKSRVDARIAALLAAGQIPEEATELATDLLTWTTENLTEAEFQEPLSLQTFGNILSVAHQFDEDNYHDHVAIIAHYLQQQEFLKKVVDAEIVGDLVDLVLDYESRLEAEDIEAVLGILSTPKSPDESPSEETNILVMVQLINALAAISGSDSFIQTFHTHSPLIQKVVSNLRHPKPAPFTVLACIILGNVATSDEASTRLVKDMNIHTPILEILSTSQIPAILYAAAGLVRHLTFPEGNRTALGDAGLIDICCNLLVKNDPSVRGEAAAIIGKLCTNNLSNIRRVIEDSVPSGLTLAQAPGIGTPNQPKILDHIITQALAPAPPVPSTSMKNISIEVGRLIVSILRYLGQTQQNSVDNGLLVHLYQIPLIARPVARLVRQRFFAEPRSEGLLGLGLMAQSNAGASCVRNEIQEDPGLLEAMKELATEGKKEASGIGRDRQNALVLLHGLTNNGVDGDLEQKEKIANLMTELSTFEI